MESRFLPDGYDWWWDRLEEAKTPFEKLDQFYKEELESLAKDQSIESKVICVALDYVSGAFYTVDDFWRLRNSILREVQFEDSFEKLTELTRSDINKEEYRRAFCRLISWVQYMHHFRRENGRLRISEKAHLNRRQLETYCRILTKLGSTDDAVQLAEFYSDWLTNEDLIRMTREAIESRNIDAGKAILEVLVSNEKAHPEVPKLINELGRLEKIKRLQETDGIDDTVIGNMSGVEFEQLIANMFEKLGIGVDITPKSSDYGADVILICPNETRVSVQCKRFKAKVNLKAVQEVVASLSHYQCDYGVVITNSTFLNSARKLAVNNDIELWDKDCLINFLSGDISFSELRNL